MNIPQAPKPGQPIYAAFLKSLRDAIIRVIVGGSGISVKRVGDKVVIENTQKQIIPQASFWARLISESDTSGEYHWRQQRNDSTVNAWEDMPGGLASEVVEGMVNTGRLAQEATSRLSGLRAHETNGQIVLMRSSVDANGTRQYNFETPRLTFKAKLTGNSALTAGAKWAYPWTEVGVDSDGAVEAITGARSGTTSVDPAYNLVELQNTSSGAIGGDGVNPAGTDYPGGAARRPIGGSGTSDTHAIDVIVEMTLSNDANGNRVFTFSQVNTHDGTC